MNFGLKKFKKSRLSSGLLIILIINLPIFEGVLQLVCLRDYLA